jgi:hypothetical protein
MSLIRHAATPSDAEDVGFVGSNLMRYSGPDGVQFADDFETYSLMTSIVGGDSVSAIHDVVVRFVRQDDGEWRCSLRIRDAVAWDDKYAVSNCTISNSGIQAVDHP